MQTAALALLLVATAAPAQPVPDPVREKPAEAAPAPEPITPPKLVEPVLADYPAGSVGAARVILQLDVDVQGLPQNVKVISSPQPGFDESALAAAAKLRFEPARRGAAPIAVRLQYAFNFVPPPPEKPIAPREKPVNLTGQVRERGTRRKLSGIEVTAAGQSALTDKEGLFELRGLPEDAPVEIVIVAPGYQRFNTRETIPKGESLKVEYRLQPEYTSPYEATIKAHAR